MFFNDRGITHYAYETGRVFGRYTITISLSKYYPLTYRNLRFCTGSKTVRFELFLNSFLVALEQVGKILKQRHV